MTSVKQDKDFIKAIAAELPDKLLQTTIDFIRDNLNPDDVFDQKRLNQFVGDAATPDEVFSSEQLEAYAKEQGWQVPEKAKSIF
jgi:hypothetical protein